MKLTFGELTIGIDEVQAKEMGNDELFKVIKESHPHLKDDELKKGINDLFPTKIKGGI